MFILHCLYCFFFSVKNSLFLVLKNVQNRAHIKPSSPNALFTFLRVHCMYNILNTSKVTALESSFQVTNINADAYIESRILTHLQCLRKNIEATENSNMSAEFIAL